MTVQKRELFIYFSLAHKACKTKRSTVNTIKINSSEPLKARNRQTALQVPGTKALHGILLMAI